RLRQLRGIGCRLHARDEVAPAGDAQAVLVQRRGVLLAAAEHRDLGHPPQMAGEEAPDHAGADYADAVDNVLLSASRPRLASSRGSSCQSEPGSSASEKISRS